MLTFELKGFLDALDASKISSGLRAYVQGRLMKPYIVKYIVSCMYAVLKLDDHFNNECRLICELSC